MNKIVTTFDGTKALRKDCKKYPDGCFYEKNKQCFLMEDGKWHRINNGKIYLNHTTNKYQLSLDGLEYGVVAINKNGSAELGYFEKDKGETILVKLNNQPIQRCMSKKVLEKSKLNFLEESKSGTFLFLNSRKKSLGKEFLKKKRGCDYSVKPDYSASYRLTEFQKYFDSKKPSDLVKPYGKYLPDFTFGIEYETYKGIIPENVCFKTGLIPVKDGSLRYPDGVANEYASVVMNNKNILSSIKAQTDALNKYCDRSYNESLHLHIGGYPITDIKLVENLFNVAKELEEEIFSLFPGFSKSTSIYKNGKKDYCKKLPDFKDSGNSTFSNLLSFLTAGEMSHPSDYRPKMYNPINNNGEHKWNVAARYSWINFDSLLFGKANTVEFRVHTTTFNKDKVAAWLFITSAILNYSINCDWKKGLTLYDVIEYSYGSKNRILFGFLVEYVKYRKEFISKCHNKFRDFIGIIDVKKDSLEGFNFITKNIV